MGALASKVIGGDQIDSARQRRTKVLSAVSVVSVDYESIVANAVAGLARNTPESRREVYQQAGAVVGRQLKLMRLPGPLVELEKLALDLTVKKVEQHWCAHEAAEVARLQASRADIARRVALREAQNASAARAASRRTTALTARTPQPETPHPEALDAGTAHAPVHSEAAYSEAAHSEVARADAAEAERVEPIHVEPVPVEEVQEEYREPALDENGEPLRDLDPDFDQEDDATPSIGQSYGRFAGTFGSRLSTIGVQSGLSLLLFLLRPVRFVLRLLFSPMTLAAVLPITAMALVMVFFMDNHTLYRKIMAGPAGHWLAHFTAKAPVTAKAPGSTPGPALAAARGAAVSPSAAPEVHAKAADRANTPGRAATDGQATYSIASISTSPEIAKLLSRKAAIGTSATYDLAGFSGTAPRSPDADATPGEPPTRVRVVRADYAFAPNPGATPGRTPGPGVRPVASPMAVAAAMPKCGGSPAMPGCSTAVGAATVGAGPSRGPAARPSDPAGVNLVTLDTLEPDAPPAVKSGAADPAWLEDYANFLNTGKNRPVVPPPSAAVGPALVAQGDAAAADPTGAMAFAGTARSAADVAGYDAGEDPVIGADGLPDLPAPVPEPAVRAPRVVPRSPKVVALVESGKRWATKGDLERAVRDFSEAVRIDAKYPDSYAERGMALFKMGETDRAIADYTAAVKRDPQHASAFRERGMANLYRGQTDLALTDLTQAIQLAEADPGVLPAIELFYARRSRAAIYDSKQQYDREVADCTALIDSYEHDPAVALSLRDNYQDAGAANIIATIFRQRATANIRRSKFDQAKADLSAAGAGSLGPDQGFKALVDRARINESVGQRDAAIADLQAALGLRPSSPEVRTALKRLGATGKPSSSGAL